MKTTNPPVTITHQHTAPLDWDRFVERCEPAHFEQTSRWALVESEDGWNATYVVARDMARIVAGAMVLVRHQPRVGKVGYILRGPLISPDLANSHYLQQLCIHKLKELAGAERLVLLVVAPPYEGHALASTFIKMGFLRHPWALPPSALPPGTITLDLQRKHHEIVRGYQRTLRKKINRALRKGVQVELGGFQDLDVFWERLLDLCNRRGVSPNVSGLTYVRRVWQEFHRHGTVWLFNATLEDNVLASLICLGIGRWCYAWRIGWDPDSGDVYPTQAVYARAIQTAAEAGYHFFDFMEIYPDEAEMLMKGEALSTRTAGVTFFKLGFGGTVRTLARTLDWFPNPILRAFMRIAGLELLSSASFLKLARRISRIGA